MIKIRCSELPRIMSCPASLDVGDVQVRSSGENASIGTAVHEVMADIIRAGNFKMPELYPYSSRNGVEVEDISFLCWRGLNYWKSKGPYLSDVDVEQEGSIEICGKILLTGHADISALFPTGSTLIIDWKTGSERDHKEQLMGYACIEGLGSCYGEKDVTVVVVNLRENVDDIRVYSKEQLRTFLDSLVATFEMENKTYDPRNDNCDYCPRRIECPARQGMMKSAAAVMEYHGKTGALSTREGLALAYEKSKQLESSLEEYNEALKMTIYDSGDITLPDGRILTLEECERVKITPSQDFFERFQWAMNKEGEGLSFNEAMKIIGEDAFTVKKQAAIKAVLAAAPKGEKDAAAERFMKELREAGCVKTTKFDKIVCKKGE